MQGIASLVLGGVGGSLFYVGVSEGINHGWSCHPGDDPYVHWGTFLIVGSVLYFPALVWDAVGGIYGVKSYNAKIEKKKHSLMEGVQPILAITESGAFAGLRIQF